MSPTVFLQQRQVFEVGVKHSAEPLAGVVMSVLLCFVSISILSIFLCQKFLTLTGWSQMPFSSWLVWFIYIDSYLFVLVSAILQFALGVNTSISVCDGAILLCLVCYVTTKIVSHKVFKFLLIYLFLVERAHIVRGTKKLRYKSKLYLFNSAGMLGIYVIIAILNFVFRITRLEDNLCIIGMQKKSMIPLIAFDAVVNVYLTMLFLIPLKKMYSFKHRQMTANNSLRTLAVRTTVGAICTLISSIVNLTVLMVLDGEPGWVCLMCCNSDIVFSAIVIQWVTYKDTASSLRGQNTASGRNGTELSLHREAGQVTCTGGSRDGDDPRDTYKEAALSAVTQRTSSGSTNKQEFPVTNNYPREHRLSRHGSQTEILGQWRHAEASGPTVKTPSDESVPDTGILVTTTISSHASWRDKQQGQVHMPNSP